MRARIITFLLFSSLFLCMFVSASHFADPLLSKFERTENTSFGIDQDPKSYHLRQRSLVRKTGEERNPDTSSSPRNLNEGQDMNMQDLNIEESMNRPLELFRTPISEWTTQDWILAAVIFFLLICIFRCLAKIGCGCCNLLNCLTCYCCYRLCCGDPDAGAGNYVPADGLC
jgi:hypothetical protein